MKNTGLVGCLAIVSAVLAAGPAAGAPAQSSSAPAVSATAQRALLDRYCVTCHNERAKRGNLSLANLDLATVGDHPEMWEAVIRKLRAGMMPPPGARRPSVADYEALRHWLEAEIDRTARVEPGTKVLHRLNRTEYANVIRDLLDLEVDPATLLPADDSSRGFDNIAGSLTISPTLLETYVTAATKVARMAVGYWSTPTESTYIKRNDGSQNLHIEGLPFGTRGGMYLRHVFQADGEYTFTIRNLGVGTYIPGEQLELIIDGERRHSWLYTKMGAFAGMDGRRQRTEVPPRRQARPAQDRRVERGALLLDKRIEARVIEDAIQPPIKRMRRAARQVARRNPHRRLPRQATSFTHGHACHVAGRAPGGDPPGEGRLAYGGRHVRGDELPP